MAGAPVVEGDGGVGANDGEGCGVVRTDHVGVKVEERPVGGVVWMKAVGEKASRLVRRERYVELIQRGG